MKKNGYTLIELLAVVSLLSLLALIAIPMVSSTINKQKFKTFRSSVDGVVDSINLDVVNDGGINEYRYIYTNGVLNVVERNGESVTGVVKTDGKIDGDGVFYAYGDKEIYGMIETDKYCGYVNGKYQVDAYEGLCGDVNMPLKFKLINSEVTVGDGIYSDSDGSYRFKGIAPDNYIRLFNGEDGLYRIIAVESQGIKIVNNNLIEEMSFDDGDVNENDCTSLICPRYTNSNSYCKEAVLDGVYLGCNVWGAKKDYYVNGNAKGTLITNSTLLTYLSGMYYSIFSDALSFIKSDALFNVGGISNESNKAISEIIEAERSATWTGKIGLINPSDYIRGQAYADSASCLANGISNVDCDTNNWLSSSSIYWTMNPLLNSASGVYNITEDGVLLNTSMSGVSPRIVLYLKSSVVASGNGSINNPYMILE